MKTLLFLLFLPFITFSQIDTAGICNFTFGLGIHGEYHNKSAFANFIVIDNANVSGCDFYATRYFISASTIDSNTNLNIVNCAEAAETCADKYIPGIAVLKDSCITDQEWENDGYEGILNDSADFFTLDAFMLYQLFGVEARDDCGIDSFYVKSLLITPPGGVSRPTGGTRRFDVCFRAVDFAGRSTETIMTWVRNNDPNCKLD